MNIKKQSIKKINHRDTEGAEKRRRKI